MGDDSGPNDVAWFDLSQTDFYAGWKGHLIIGWPPPERSWWRHAHRNDFPILALLEDSALDAAARQITFPARQRRVRLRQNSFPGLYLTTSNASDDISGASAAWAAPSDVRAAAVHDAVDRVR